VYSQQNGFYPVYFDHRPFYYMVEDFDMTPAELVGQYVEVVEADQGEYVRFPELM